MGATWSSCRSAISARRALGSLKPAPASSSRPTCKVAPVARSHVHPKDIGGAILSLDYMDPWTRWEWGGPVWRENVRSDTSTAIVGAELQGQDPSAMAGRWGEVLGSCRLQPIAAGWRIGLDGGEIRFVSAADGRGDGLGRFDVAVRDPDAVRAAAQGTGAGWGREGRRGAVSGPECAWSK